jgi:hypothetical protein
VTPLEDRRLLSLSPTNIVVSAHPKVLSPPDSQFVAVTVSGSFNESSPDASPSGFFYLTDQYGEIGPYAGVDLHQSPTDPSTYTFSFTLHLQAKRGSMTENGRQYDILVGARDAAGAVGKTIAVWVPKNPVPTHHHKVTATAHHRH